MNTHADKTQENKSQAVANGGSQRRNSGDSTFQFENSRPEAIAQRRLREIVKSSPQSKQATQLHALAANYHIHQSNHGKVKQRVKEINHVSEDISGVCGYMALHVAFSALNPIYNEGKDWATFKKEDPTIQANDSTSICTIEDLMKIIAYYKFEGVVHKFNTGPELVDALRATGANPVLIGHTLLGVPQRSGVGKTEGDRAHWSVISSVKNNMITLWDNWCDGGQGVRDKPYEIDAEELAKKSLILENQTHEYPKVSDDKIKERKQLDIHGRLVEVKLK